MPEAHPAVPAGPLVDAFESHRDRLRAVAYRVLGSHADAEDVVQEAWLRLSRQDAGAIDNLGGWLTTVVGRISLDVLRSGRTRPEAVLDDGLPEFTVTLDEAPAPEELVALGDSVGLALLTVLDSLRPDERLAFVLHDVFAVPHAEIGTILGKSADATKMLTSRARRKVRAAPRPAGGAREQREVVRAFLAAAGEGRFEELLRVLHPEVEFTVHTPAGRFVTIGATEVAGRARVAGGSTQGHAATVNGFPGVISWHEDGTPRSLLAFTVAEGRITAITAVVDPAALALMELPDPV
ncbi:RNA polymerase subunit sigma-70 [Streptomyces alfalfae]|uniref:RNA polymerase subunit sigma-70 n=1 Tax=Streptomyces alfalfae TaxID=1642299 RepID=A0A1P8TQY6_9ACTN|nr:sigma-70 family RNA polymerase sigma factor [Streptomyces alfalfae]AYA20509.1 sigma-70 family RNA polymerase sigma factor [Streptomyces fradiae]APY90047.1 RNA polymerase subunit sigma-70 [Streptomyces alfalfae]QQC87447.1 sigma-70 family RNA polymerase sigma factor [Streptomyces alfalfae]RXX42874.1 RNA polymerase subunit sigma-70 [Streptomyces alfalfae]RZM86298.1 sigma-70 family RNA polymerase sigma factor [Streptomyces alfalfae]